MIDTGSIPVIQFTEPDTIRLIPQAYITEPALAPLADDDNEMRIIEALEQRTSGRQNESIPLPADFSPTELLGEAHGYGWTYINNAFCLTREGGNRFNDAVRGAWYAAWGADAVSTAQAEVGFHLARELGYTGIYENITDYRELVAGFTASLHDLSAFTAEPFLSVDTDIAYPAGQHLAKTLRSDEASGILYPSIRHDGGQCLAAFRPNLVQNIRQGSGWRFTWDGAQEPVITKIQL